MVGWSVVVIVGLSGCKTKFRGNLECPKEKGRGGGVKEFC